MDNQFWDGFYTHRARPIPFFVDAPDECLVEWLRGRQIAPGNSLDVGCGNGRNSAYLAYQGFEVTGVDFSQTAIDWAKERDTNVTWVCASIFDLPAQEHSFAYDSGCFHHIHPSQRIEYVQKIASLLKPGGWFGLVCFRPEGGSGMTDDEVIEQGTMGGGLGYSEKQLRAIWSPPFEIVELRQMRKPSPDEGLFGEDFLWAMLAQLKADGCS